MATLPLKLSRNEHRAVIDFYGQKDLMQMRFTLEMRPVYGDKCFASDTEVQSLVRQWLGQQPASFFASGIQ